MKIAIKSFTGGEVSGSLSARYDLDKYPSFLRHCENFIPELHGPLRKRMGTRFLEDLGTSPAVLLPFQFSSDPTQNYALIFQEKQIRVAQRNGCVTTEGLTHVTIETPYLTEELYDISFSQSGDMVYLAHHNHPLMKLVRYGHRDWKLEDIGFMPSIDPPEGFSVTWHGAGGSYPIRYKIASVNKKGEVSEAVGAQANNGKHVNDWVVGEYTTLNWDTVEGAETYNVYRQEAGTYGLIGVTEETSFRDEKYRADTADTPSEPQNPFVEGNNPSVVCFHQQRLVLGAPYLEPQTWYASRTGNYEDFSKSRPVKDDDSLEYTIASGRIDNIQWMTSFGDLLIGTAGSEHKAVGADQGTLTPSSVNIREQSFWGSLRLRPLIIGNSIIHVQRQGSRVRDLFYSLEKDGYAGNDLFIMAPHLFDRFSIRQWDYQQAPGSLIWAIRNDGVMLVMVYMQEHDIWGWSRVSTQGKFTSVVVNSGHLEDDVYCVVAREVGGEEKYYLERIENRWFKEDGVEKAFFLDSGLSYEGDTEVKKVSGLEHLEGRLVDILANGSPVEPQVVKNGSVELPYPAKDIHVGLNYKAIMSPHVPEADTEQGTSYGRVRNYATSKISLLDSAGGKYGQSTDEEDLYKFDWVPAMWSEAVDPETGFRDFNLNTPFSEDGAFYIVQDEPLPFTVASLVLDVDYQA